MASKCPICKTQVLPYGENKSFPFCGPRCKLADLHSWFEAKYTVPDYSSSPSDPEGYDDGGDGPNLH